MEAGEGEATVLTLSITYGSRTIIQAPSKVSEATLA